MPQVAITRPVPAVVEEILEAAGIDWTYGPPEPGIEALICTPSDPVDAAMLDSLAPTLKVIANFAVGVNNIDLDAARARDVVVTNTPDVLTDATAEVAIGLMLACARRFLEGDHRVRQGLWEGWAPMDHIGRPLYEATVGIVGAGRIGRRVGATLEAGFGCRVLYHRPTPLPELLVQSDFVSLHCPLKPETRHLIGARELARMKPNAYLINTARGPVVDERALIAALADGVIAGAGLDVYEHEPRLAPGLAELDNVVLLPHIGSATTTTRRAMGRLVAESIVAVLRGEEPAHRVV